MPKLIAILDTNILLRHLLGDDRLQSPPATRLIEGAPQGSLYLPATIIAELTWALKWRWRAPRVSIREALHRLLENQSIEVHPITRQAVARYAVTNVDFADCLLAARAAETDATVATYDRDFRKFSDIAARTPSELLAGLQE